MRFIIYIILSIILFSNQVHSQEFKTHRSNLHNFTVQIPSDAIVLNESAEFGILFRSEYWKKVILFTPTSFVDPASISSFELSGYMMLNNFTPIENSYILEKNYLCQKIKTVIANQSAIGYCIFLPWTRQQGIAMIMMYGEENGFGDKIQAIALEYVRGFNNTNYIIRNSLINSSVAENNSNHSQNKSVTNSPRTPISLSRSGKVNTYSDKYYNFSFSIPEEYTLEPSDFDDKFVFAQNNDYPKVLVYHNDFKSIEDIYESGILKEYIIKEENGHLIHKSKSEDGVLYLASLTYSQKGGTTLYVMDNKREEAEALKELNTIRKSINQGILNKELHADRYRRLISNKKLTFMFTGSGYSEKRIFNLCSDGTFFRNSATSGFSTTYGTESTDYFSANLRSKGDGTWTIFTVGNRVYLRFNQNDDTYIEHKLYYDEKKQELYLGGERFFVTDFQCK